MGTYFQGSSNSSDIQPSAEGMQTLYLMNPNYVVPYSEEPQNPTQNMLFTNPNATTNTPPSPHALNVFKFPHAPSSMSQHNIVGFTVPPSNFHGSNSTDSSTQPYQASGFHAIPSSAAETTHPPHTQYNTWGSGSFIIPDQTVTVATTSNISESQTVATVTTSAATEFSPQQIGYHHRPVYQRGLSLSLSSQQTPYRSFSGEVEVSRGGDNPGGVVFGSKYLKVAQELLDEVVNVDKGIMKGESVEGNNTNNNDREKRKANIESSSSGGRENDGGKQVVELSTAQRQELQMKKSKLVNMLDEVYVYVSCM